MAPQQPMANPVLGYIVRNSIMPAMALLPMKLNSTPAVVMLLAIGLQESRFVHRTQIGGPAHGFWQFERGGGVKGVLGHPSTVALIREVCLDRQVPFDAESVYQAIVQDDILAAAMARLLLFSDPKPLPDVKDRDGAWDCYVRNWRPGKPHRDTWESFHNAARAVVGV